ncbi:hypothetical protein J7554_08550 [Wohlfahrtiimonas chitiniclastica]|uniref:hypothetical protein n=1 Tax=Wohlfahrtiimonas chitiniclastica TaxID=400946 RepID=UPI001BCB4300|nr:hypothetical protein [Wohlfahrtiimonas chitiniclastica]MBS7829175.1 hypothetical protein [Wohlfahrtiimonas chitiniclastica]
MYIFHTIDQTLRQLDTERIKERVGEDFFNWTVNSVKFDAHPPRLMLILDRWLRTNEERVKELLMTDPGREKLLMELKMQANEEQEYLERPEILNELQNGQSINELLNQSDIYLNLQTR